jgi:hypothetical protein
MKSAIDVSAPITRGERGIARFRHLITHGFISVCPLVDSPHRRHCPGNVFSCICQYLFRAPDASHADWHHHTVRKREYRIHDDDVWYVAAEHSMGVLRIQLSEQAPARRRSWHCESRHGPQAAVAIGRPVAATVTMSTSSPRDMYGKTSPPSRKDSRFRSAAASSAVLINPVLLRFLAPRNA